MSASDSDGDKKTGNDENETEEIRSTAVVKYSVPKVENFIELQCNTNLNLPPSNWLSDSGDSYGLQRVSRGQEGFSSFRMAQMFPEVVVNVDVIADAENIKKLLKSPYNKEIISMVVHRVGNTLLIDNFDIYEKIIRTRSQNKDFKWLEEFFINHLSAKACQDARNLYVEGRTREALREKNLLSKFRYHSLVDKQSELLNDNDSNQAHSSRSVEYSFLPNPAPDTETPDSETFNHKYNRNVVWTFENIQMLLGTDMPIFGRGTYPCISLRLRDVNKPINILTGIDYWLDNLMSNVPEVFMCYHLNGIVQKYELIKTEDIPRLKNSRFSPMVIKDVAQNILSFLKMNATKAGHTYWLFKGKDEEIIKLYDLTCLVPQDEKLQNPFTIPVAMLLYRVARSFMKSNEKKPSGTVKKLLTNCLKLLDEQKYPEIVTSSHFMMSEIYVPADINPENPVFEQENCDNDLVYEADDEMLPTDGEAESTISYLDLEAKKTSTFVNKSAPPITGTTEERCLQAISHMSKGLDCLKFFSEETNNALQDDKVPMAKPNEPIPMGYTKLPEMKKGKKGKKNKGRKAKSAQNKELIDEEKALLIKHNQEAQELPKWKERHGKKDGISWKDHLKILLYEKALLVYATLAEHYYKSSCYGSSLRCIGILARCSVIINCLRVPNQLRENCLLGRAGDCFFMIAHYWKNHTTYQTQLRSFTIEDNEMLVQLENDERQYEVDLEVHDHIKCVFAEKFSSNLQTLMQAVDCYEGAMAVSETNSIIQRLGCCLNDVGKYYLNSSRNCDSSSMCKVVSCAEPYFQRALDLFERINDKSNIALVYLNVGTMHRMLCYASTARNGRVFTKKHFSSFNKVISYHNKALAVLGSRENNVTIWNSVYWELSTTLYDVANLMELYPAKDMSIEELQKEFLEALNKALLYCNNENDLVKFPLYQHRAAMIHYKIAAVLEKQFLKALENSSSKKTQNALFSSANIHFEKSTKLFFLCRDGTMYFKALIQNLSLTELLAESAVNSNKQSKLYQDALHLVLEAQVMTDVLSKQDNEGIIDNCIDDSPDGRDDTSFDSLNMLVKLSNTRLQFILLTLVKLYSTTVPPLRDSDRLYNIYKKCYKSTFILNNNMTQDEFILNLNVVLNEIKQIIHEK